MKWEKVKLGDCCASISDGDHQPPPKVKSGIPFVTISNISSSNQFDFCDTMFVPQKYYDKLDTKRKAQKNDILYSVVGSFGIPVLIKDHKRFVFKRHLAILRPDSRVVFPKFLYYVMLSKEFYALADTVAVGAAQRTISLSALRNIEISLPDIEKQKRIASILSAYDDLIENNQRQIKLLEEAAQRLYKEWFVDFRFPGYEHTPIVDGVPEGWERKRLGDIADIVMGQSPKSEFYNQKKDGLPFHQGVGSYGYRFVTDDIFSSTFTRIATKGSILFSVRAPVGRMNYTRNRIAIGRGLAAINSKTGLQSFLFYLLKDKYFKDDLIGNGSIFASITKDELYGQIVIVPSPELANRFDEYAKSIDKKIELLDLQIKTLSEARDRLLPKLMSGELEV